MSTATVPAPTNDDALAALRELLMGPDAAPAPVTTMWSVSCAVPGVRIFMSAFRAAEFIVDESRRRVKARNLEPLTVQRLDGGMQPDWDASANVADVFTATRWLRRCTNDAYAVKWLLRDEVVEVVRAILVTDD